MSSVKPSQFARPDTTQKIGTRGKTGVQTREGVMKAATSTLLGRPTGSIRPQTRIGVRLNPTELVSRLEPLAGRVGSFLKGQMPSKVNSVATKFTSVASKTLKTLIDMFKSTPPPIDEDDIIFDALNADNLSKIFVEDVQSIKNYIGTNPAPVADIKYRLSNEVQKRTGQNPQNSDVSTLVHIIIDYMYSNSVDFSDTTYTDEQLNQFFKESAIEERRDGLRDPTDVYSVANAEFKNLVPLISPKEFTERLNSAGILGVFYPIYGDKIPDNPYDPVRGKEIFDAMQAAEKLIRTQLLEKYVQISVQKLKEESDLLNILGEANERTIKVQQELEKMERAVRGQRVLVKTSSDEIDRFITEQTKIIAAKAIAVAPAAAAGLASNDEAVNVLIKSMEQSGGKKIIHKSKNARKSNKSKKTTKKRTKSKSKSNKNRK